MVEGLPRGLAVKLPIKLDEVVDPYMLFLGVLKHRWAPLHNQCHASADSQDFFVVGLINHPFFFGSSESCWYWLGCKGLRFFGKLIGLRRVVMSRQIVLELRYSIAVTLKKISPLFEFF